MEWLLFIVWLVFAVIFGFLGYQNWKFTNKKIPHFVFEERPMRNDPDWKIMQVDVMGEDFDAPEKRFINGFNKYIDDYNQSQIKSNELQAIGYWVACGTAILSAIITVI